MESEKNKIFNPGVDRVLVAQAVFDQAEMDAVQEVLKKGWLGPGEASAEFETKIAQLFGKKYGLFVNSGTSANIVAMEIANLPRGSEVITQACTFPATLSPIIFSDHIPVFVDSLVGTYNIDVDQIESAISEKTKAIFISHAVGNINDMIRIREICDKHGLLFIEDSCDTHGSKYQGEAPGKWSDITTTSFYASHNITAGGGGGMVMVNSEAMIKDAKVVRDWGRALPENYDENIDERFDFKVDGIPYDGKFTFLKLCYNFKPVEMQAAFGLVQLEKLSKFNEIRKKNFARLYEFFKNYPEHFILPETLPETDIAWLAFPLTIKEGSSINRKELLTYLENNKIQTRLLFSGNVLRHVPYKSIPHRKVGDLKNSDFIMKNTFLIGLNHSLTDEMIDYVTDKFKNYIK
ncbi:NarL family transcriptional regulator [archaeon]|nr:NarL family transcriptional regulator [archaeon]